MTQRYLQPQNNDILWDINATNISNINNHNMTMELSGNNGYVVNINNSRQLTIGNSYLHLPVGGGCAQGGSGSNAGGGGGSGFVGFTNSTPPNKGTSGTLLENTSGTPIGYTDATTRTNGGRTYTNSETLRFQNQIGGTGSGYTAPPKTSDPDYPYGYVGYGAGHNSDSSGGNGYVVIKY